MKQLILEQCNIAQIDVTDFFRIAYYAKKKRILIREVFQVDVVAFEKCDAIPKYVREYMSTMLLPLPTLIERST